MIYTETTHIGAKLEFTPLQYYMDNIDNPSKYAYGEYPKTLIDPLKLVSATRVMEFTKLDMKDTLLSFARLNQNTSATIRVTLWDGRIIIGFPTPLYCNDQIYNFGSKTAPIMVLTHLIRTVEKKSDEDGSWVPLL